MSDLQQLARQARLETQEDKHNWVLLQGAKAGGLAGVAGGFLHLFANSRVPLYQRQTIPFKVFLVLMIPTAAFFTQTDRAAMYADRIHAQKFSITKEDELETASPQKQLSTTDWLMKNRFRVLGYSWVAAMTGSLAYNFSRKNVPMSYKLINSRMIAQSLVLGGLVSLALLASSVPKDDKRDLHYERIVNQKV